ncbi:hypothetical protein GC105_11530 [Alkalibaculum sp. M08DMB]|uniref:Uncharacterized protein n=1 Tax=Alkalibaculum sporogenes TaxID=2655001 RepID=A0A6A7KAA0_9FIRM|nr:hypothetical protein [Alkalibaculum sporogenes]MPW26420.1 hypothetical protein [Alkalibaculum sporogenes]
MKKICVECGITFETKTVSVTCSEKCKRVRYLRKRKEYHSYKNDSFSAQVDSNYSEGENVLVHRYVRENNEKVKQKEVAKVIKVYPYFVLCEIKLRNRNCLESFRFDEVKRVEQNQYTNEREYVNE